MDPPTTPLGWAPRVGISSVSLAAPRCGQGEGAERGHPNREEESAVARLRRMPAVKPGARFDHQT